MSTAYVQNILRNYNQAMARKVFYAALALAYITGVIEIIYSTVAAIAGTTRGDEAIYYLPAIEQSMNILIILLICVMIVCGYWVGLLTLVTTTAITLLAITGCLLMVDSPELETYAAGTVIAIPLLWGAWKTAVNTNQYISSDHR